MLYVSIINRILITKYLTFLSNRRNHLQMERQKIKKYPLLVMERHTSDGDPHSQKRLSSVVSETQNITIPYFFLPLIFQLSQACFRFPDISQTPKKLKAFLSFHALAVTLANGGAMLLFLMANSKG